jgi:hypothetical protein
MKIPQTMKVLLELEAHYASLLSGVQKLIAEQGRSSNPTPTDTAKLNGAFSTLKKADAAEQILRERGKLRAQDIFDAMKLRGHPVASKSALYAMLSTNKKRFKRKKRGIWSLVTTAKQEL